ncbi:uncharacterized protein LOC117123164 [Anneissia japonica]|uniref:uncharacterized protein LOC117123164 n=1 Tax=Anneissia japonica TaxID=1529436 RepID=UPI001425BA3C|nr:uncharacterized protein LOC117123164 [Anneissia japonica]
MIALVVVLSIIIIFLIFSFGLYYRYNHPNGNNAHKCVQDDKLTKNTRVVEETTELNTYNKLVKDDLIQQEDHYEVIKTKTQDTYDYAMPHNSGLEVTTPAEENIEVTENKNEPYEIPLKCMGHKSDFS